MKALVLREYKKFSYENFERPSPGDGEVLIRVEACGICGSDVHGMDGSTGRRIPHIIMGHEAAGIIEELGKNVSGWSVGDHVTFDSTVYCGECDYCRQGRVNLCDNRMVLGVSCNEYRRHGAFAEYVTVPARILYRLPDSVTFEQAAMVEALSIAVHAVSRVEMQQAATAMVVGAGMIGLLVIQSLRAAGVDEVWAVDIDDAKLEMANKMGAAVALNPSKTNMVNEVHSRAKGGLEIAIEVVGATPSIQTAVRSVRKGGDVVLVGNVSPLIDLPLQEVVTREITLHGSCASAGEYPKCLDLIGDKKVDVDFLISKVAPLSEGAEWFNRLYTKDPGLMKVILKPGK
jgi:L-iditol 2-dehydrogenase